MSSSSRPVLDRDNPPQPGPPRSFQFPDFELHTLANGLQIYLAAYPRAPLVHQLLILPGGAQQDPLDRSGLAAITASLIDEGTDLQSAPEIAEKIETLGGYLSSQADWDTMSASLGTLAKNSRQGLTLLAEIATRASYPDEEIERRRSQHLAELQRRRSQPSNLASDFLSRSLYENTIYQTPLLGTSETVAAVSRTEVLDTARREVTPDGASLILVGDLEPTAILKLANEVFGHWNGPSRSEPATIAPAVQEGMRLCLVDRSHAPQTELWLGSVGVPRSHPDRAGLAVLNSLFGGKFTSRINLNLRERLGITYGVSTSFSQRRGPGPFIVAASVDTDAVQTAIQEIVGEIQRLQDEPVSEDELVDTQSYLLGIFPYTLQRIEGLASRLADLAVYDLPRDYFSSYLQQIAAVTREDLQSLAQRHWHPTRMSVVAVGPRQVLESQLGPFGTPEIHLDPSTSSDPAVSI